MDILQPAMKGQSILLLLNDLPIYIIPPSFDLKKIYAANYPVVITGNGRRKPTVNTDIIKTMNQGTLLVNYIGHGNPELWAHEYIFERGRINSPAKQ